MELAKAIDNRHSIREFEEKKVSKKLIKELIESGTKSPSACNRQPWIFYCVDSKEKRNQIAKLLKETLKVFKKDIDAKPTLIRKVTQNFYSNLGGAQNIIFIFREKKKNDALHIKPNDFASIACCAENIMLKAVELGLGSCWVGSFKDPKTEKKLSKLIRAKTKEELVCSLIIGYPKKDSKVLKREKRNLGEIINFV